MDPNDFENVFWMSRVEINLCEAHKLMQKAKPQTKKLEKIVLKVENQVRQYVLEATLASDEVSTYNLLAIKAKLALLKGVITQNN